MPINPCDPFQEVHLTRYCLMPKIHCVVSPSGAGSERVV